MFYSSISTHATGTLEIRAGHDTMPPKGKKRSVPSSPDKCKSRGKGNQGRGGRGAAAATADDGSRGAIPRVGFQLMGRANPTPASPVQLRRLQPRLNRGVAYRFNEDVSDDEDTAHLAIIQRGEMVQDFTVLCVCAMPPSSSSVPIVDERCRSHGRNWSQGEHTHEQLPKEVPQTDFFLFLLESHRTWQRKNCLPARLRKVR